MHTVIKVYVWGTPQKMLNYILEGRPEDNCSRSPSVSVYQLVLQWEAAFGFSGCFLKTFSMLWPILWWVIYERTCPHCAECYAVFDPNWHKPTYPTLPVHPVSPWVTLLFPMMKKVLKGKYFANVDGRGGTKTGRNTKRHQNWLIQKLFWAAEKSLDKSIAPNREYFEGNWSLNE